MNNYDQMLRAARRRFLEYDPAVLAHRTGVAGDGENLVTCFLGQQALIRKADGTIFLNGKQAGFGESLSLYDWLCDRKPDAAAAMEFCPVSSLPGVYVGGKGLTISSAALAREIHENPGKFAEVCPRLGARAETLGDLGFRFEIFPDLPMCLKFYFGDEEFPPSLTLLWDKNTLRFVRYETVYYIAACLQARLMAMMKE